MFFKVKRKTQQSKAALGAIRSGAAASTVAHRWGEPLVVAGLALLFAPALMNSTASSVAAPTGLFISHALAQDSDIEESETVDDSSFDEPAKPNKFREGLRERAQLKEKEVTTKDTSTNSDSKNPAPSTPSAAAATKTNSGKATPIASVTPPRAANLESRQVKTLEKKTSVSAVSEKRPPNMLADQELLGDSILIYRIFSSEFTPQRAKFVVSFVDGSNRLENATVISLRPAGAEGAVSEWAIGARIFPPPGLEISQVAGIIYGDGVSGGNTVKLLEPKRWSQEQDSLLAESSDELRSLIKRAEAKIKDLEQIQRNQNDELRRLRSDLDILVNSGRIKDYRGELQKAEAALRQATEDIRALNQLLATSGKQTTAPRNFQQREADLIATNLDLEKILRDEEGRFYEERSKQVAISPERRKMLADIGRGASLEGLKRDLAALVLKRSKLESGESEGE